MTDANIHTASAQPDNKLSSWQEDPLLHLKRAQVAFLQGLFGFAPRGQFHWSSDLSQTEIVITGDSPTNVETLQQRPAIQAIRGTAAAGGLSMDELRDVDSQTGKRDHLDLMSGTTTFNCISRVPNESEKLAFLVFRHLWLLRRMLMRTGFHEFGRKQQISAPSPANAMVVGESEHRYIATTVTVPWYFALNFSVQELNVPLIQHIKTTISTALAPVTRTDTSVQLYGTAMGRLDENGNIAPPRRVNRGFRPARIRGRVIQQAPNPGSQTAGLTLDFEVGGD